MTQTINTTKNVFYSLAEAAEFAGVSERTVQRHVLLNGKGATAEIPLKGRLTKVYIKDWLIKEFDVVDSNKSDTSNPIDEKTENQLNTSHGTTKNKHSKNKVVSDIVSVLKDQVQILSDELKFKNEQLQVKDKHISSLIESEKNTKTLLADLQIQNKALQLPAQKNAPTAKQSGKKWRKVWLWVSIILLIGLAVGAYAYNYYFGFKNFKW